MTWRELLIGCIVACALTAVSVLATRSTAPEAPRATPPAQVFD